MSCRQLENHELDSTRPNLADHQISDMNLRAKLVEAVFTQLHGTWVLNRRLQSTNIAEPAGNCIGTATFTRRESSVFIKNDGKLELASDEMVYHEEGHFEMHQDTTMRGNNMRFPFSRKYVWRLQRQANGQTPVLSIWFTKPGTEKIDYLFHKVSFTLYEADDPSIPSNINIVADGGHLCEDDIYSSNYTFSLTTGRQDLNNTITQANLENWKMLHEVRGPNKDQLIDTFFTKP